MTDKQMLTSSNESLPDVVSTRKAARAVPAVDIFETTEALILKADLPGVEEQQLKVETVRGTLTIEAEAPADSAIHVGYFRQFKLSELIAAEVGEAILKDGVLTLRLPKAEAAMPKKIAVKTIH